MRAGLLQAPITLALALLAPSLAAGQSSPPRSLDAPASRPSGAATSPAHRAGTAVADADASARTSLAVELTFTERDGSMTPAAGALAWFGGGAKVAEERTVKWREGGPTPELLTLGHGSTVRFVRADALAHNLFAQSAATTFDIDLTAERTSATVRFEAAGVVDVFCNDHAAEELRVVVADGTPRPADASGQVRFEGLDAGPRELATWHPRAELERRPIEVAAGEARSLTFGLTRARGSRRHKNKHGASYPPVPGRVEVTVERSGNRGKRSPVEGAVVWLEGSPPASIPGVRRTAAGTPQVSAREKKFSPRVQAVPAGGTVDFPNYDRIFHNVFSLSETKTFDLGLYRDGKSESVEFEAPGIVKVYCNIHPKMIAYVRVVDGENHALTDEGGRAVLDGVPPGQWTLRVWDERGGDRAETIEVASGGTRAVAVVLEAGADRQERTHLNKYGEEYPDPDDEDSRY